MDLHFPIKRIQPKKDFQNKLQFLGINPLLDRILVNFHLINDKDEIIFSSNAIFDTGAPFSLLPGLVLNDLPNIKSIPHTIIGIINAEECEVKTDLVIITIIFEDSLGNLSPKIPILTAFSKKENTPYLLGMNGILSNSGISIEITEKEMILHFKGPLEN